MSEILFPQLIASKRDGKELSEQEIQRFIDGVVKGEMQDSQIGAMLMAIYLKDMTPKETSYLTNSMIKSGLDLDWKRPDWKDVLVDKHSTGGVGDKISLALTPALAACGMKVPMITGRGLAHTGGTLDKLESIPGFQANQELDKMKDILDKVGCFIVGQTASLVPADKMLYATRDVTGTVPSIPLIVGSIISKKGSEGLKALVLDVKTGRGALMETEKDSRELARQMVEVGHELGIAMTACLTSMDCPIGRMVGNSLEIIETIECLHGKGPKDTVELITKEGGHLLYNAGKASSPEEGAEMINKALNDGTAMAKFCALIKAQGVASDTADALCAKDANVRGLLPEASSKTPIKAPQDGYVNDIHAMKCGLVSYNLGAGRAKAGDPVDHAVGLEFHVAVGDAIKKGQPWVTVHHNKPLDDKNRNSLEESLTISPTPVPDRSLVIDIIRPKA